MKKVKSILATMMLVALVSISGYAQNQAKVIAVINKADWCPACQQNGERAMAAFSESNKDLAIQFVANDLTNDETKAKSAIELKKLGVDKAIAEYNGTGVAYFFNAETKALISQISVAKSNEELALACDAAKKAAKL
ncbi:MAG: hypothetical protein CVT92_15625 [Bacteroidetes bacterium HGW-Bacteroidetes-1]|jgi:spermidine/putrescine-binding protein|nr:MAG: hypothetical protein CVT92_15625 [Bacteroidetes bacterium HGW-Bacteroidetes-1]